MARIKTTIEIGRPQDEVFAYMTDLRNAKEWSVGLVDVSYDGELAEGTSGRDVRKLGGKQITMPWKVVIFDTPRRATFEYGDPFPATAEFSFDPTARGTKVTCETHLRPKGLWRLLGPVMAMEGRKTDRLQFQKVKEILEGRASRRSAGRRA
jgi:hypothetical protein